MNGERKWFCGKVYLTTHVNNIILEIAIERYLNFGYAISVSTWVIAFAWLTGHNLIGKTIEQKLLGQGSSLQDLDSSLSPGHGLPSNCGGGLVHVLDLSCTPPPHVTGQSLQSFQSDQYPSTELNV